MERLKKKRKTGLRLRAGSMKDKTDKPLLDLSRKREKTQNKINQKQKKL